tara:strand:- start:916 stop:1650 length:735 start_codon:yes stop_codon:yes gene_type:complete
MLQVEGLYKVYPNGIRALNGLSFEIKEGEFVVALGQSGSGKSTLLRCLNRLVEPTCGRVFLQQDEVTGADPKMLRACRRRIGMVFQEFNLINRTSVLTNVLTGRLGFVPSWQSLVNYFSIEDRMKAMEVLDLLEIGDKENHPVSSLSGGQRQRVGIARALMQNPAIILADEPVASLDPRLARMTLDILMGINRKKRMTILCSLHQPELAMEYGGRVMVLKSGECIFNGSPKKLGDNEIINIYGH